MNAPACTCENQNGFDWDHDASTKSFWCVTCKLRVPDSVVLAIRKAEKDEFFTPTKPSFTEMLSTIQKPLGQSTDEGVKNDDGRPRYDLIPAMPMERVAEVYAIGANKYGDRNWEKGMAFGRLFRAMLSHAWKWWRGEKFDKEDGQHHLASVVFCALGLMQLEETHPEKDDRP